MHTYTHTQIQTALTRTLAHRILGDVARSVVPASWVDSVGAVAHAQAVFTEQEVVGLAVAPQAGLRVAVGIFVGEVVVRGAVGEVNGRERDCKSVFGQHATSQPARIQRNGAEIVNKLIFRSRMHTS